MKKRILWISIAVIFAAVISWQIYRRASKSSSDSGMSQMSIPVAVEITAVNKSQIRDLGQFTGTLFPKSQFIIAPKISGRLEKLLVHIGDRVKRDQLIAILDDEEYSQQVAQALATQQVAQANLEEALSSLEIAKRSLERAQALHKKGLVADSELDAAQASFKAQDAKYKVAVAQVAHTEAALRAAQVRLSYTQIRASWQNRLGHRVVGERFVDEGAMLTPNAAILSVLEIHPIVAAIYLTDKDYFRVKKGQNADITSKAFPDKIFKGKIERIAPLLKETSREARVEIEVPNQDEFLKPGMFINAQIEFINKKNAIVVPISAVVKRDSQQGVFLADTQNMKARFIPVSLGIISGEFAEVVDPPSLSGFVVTLGQHLLSDSSSITLPPEWEGTSPTKSTDSESKKSSGQSQIGEKK
ncbi:MAG: efflux RND transporter periplasmic adaptor subunit [Candidatus Aminicenantaceae bacterium]